MSGLGHPPVPHRACIRRHPGHFAIEGESWLAVSVGVGHNEDTLPKVWGTAGGGRNPEGTASISKRAETFSDVWEPASRAALDVLDDDDGGAGCSNHPTELKPKRALRAFDPMIPPSSRLGYILTREAAADEVGRLASERADVVMLASLGPVAGQYPAAEGVDLYLPHGATEPGALKPQLEPTDTAE